MQDDPIPEERLAALADGELSGSEAAALRARIAGDAALAERYALFVETRELLAPEPDVVADAGHDRLAAAILGADVAAKRPKLSIVDGGQAPRRPGASEGFARTRPPARFRVAAPALAASLALVVGGALGFAVGRGDAPAGSSTGDVVAAMAAPGLSAAIASALETTPSGRTVAWADEGASLKGAVAVISTHRLGQGVCREYEATVTGRDGEAVGLGCRRPDGTWRTEVVARKRTGGDGYGTASGASVVESAIEAMGGEGPLSAEDESRAIAEGWAKAP